MVPTRIKISREPNYYTHYIGRCDDRTQFMALITATLPIPTPADWQHHKRWYAVLHRFQADGDHTSTDAQLIGVTADGEDEVVETARKARDEMLRKLGSFRFCDVTICQFSVEIHGSRFGLINTSDASRQQLTLFPNDFVFRPPWDGSYDT